MYWLNLLLKQVLNPSLILNVKGRAVQKHLFLGTYGQQGIGGSYPLTLTDFYFAMCIYDDGRVIPLLFSFCNNYLSRYLCQMKPAAAVGTLSILAHRSDPWVIQTCVPRVNI